MTTSPTNLPLFYKDIVPFDTALHGQLRRPDSADFRFASNATVIPLVVSDLAQAIRHYPVVLLPAPDGGVPTLAALVGLGNERNLFVSPEGVWRTGTYIPAYARRYPFHALRVETQKEPLLGIDATYAVAPDGDTLVAADGKPSAYLADMLTFTRDYLEVAERTNAMCKLLDEADVLQGGDITLQVAEGNAQQINGFLQVSEERLRALSPEALSKLHQADALGLAYSQLLSMANFVHLPLPQATPEPEKPQRYRSKEKAK